MTEVPPPVARIVVADDHEIVRQGVRSLLQSMPGVTVVGEAADGNQLLAVVEATRPDIVVTDLSMPGMDGSTAIAHLHAEHPSVRILVLSVLDSPEDIRRALANGASSYVDKGACKDDLQLAIRHLLGSASYFSPRIAEQLADESPQDYDGLTERQVEVLRCLALGGSSKEIAWQLGLSSKTVDVHRSRIMERLKLHDIASLTRYAVRKGLVRL